MIGSVENNSACGVRVYPLLYPLNKSLAEEVERLFSRWSFSYTTADCETTEDDVMTEFRLNGQDSEYCPEFFPTNTRFAESNGMLDFAAGCASAATVTRSRKRAKKQIQECAFCKNNGEQESYYKRHILKDSEGRIVCPVLRAYTCPICNAKGDKAHTIKYCPLNSNPDPIAQITTLKSLRTSTGHRRNKSISLIGPEIHVFHN